jgi:hypothetical protein
MDQKEKKKKKREKGKKRKGREREINHYGNTKSDQSTTHLANIVGLMVLSHLANMAQKYWSGFV